MCDLSASSSRLDRIPESGFPARIDSLSTPTLLSESSRFVIGKARLLLFDDKALNFLIQVVTDISEQQRQELDELSRKLAHQARIFDTALSHISDFVYVIDRAGNFIYANQPLLDLWGLSLDQAVGKNFSGLGYAPELAARFQAQVQTVIAKASTITDETSYVSPAGVEGFYEYIFNPILSPEGVIEGVAGSTRVITERKRTEEHARFLSQFGQRLALQTEPSEILDTMVQVVGEYLRADRCYVCEWDAHLGRATVKGDWRADDSPRLVGTYSLLNFGPKEWWALLTAGNVSIEDLEKHFLARDFLPSYQALGVRSYATARFKRETPGVVTLIVTMKTPRAWRPDELVLLENVIARAWPLIERAREDKHTAFLNGLSEKISLLTDPNEITRTAVQSVGDHLEIHRCYFFEPLSETNGVRITENWHRPGVTGIAGDYALSGFGSGNWSSAVQSRRVVVEDVSKETELRADCFFSLGIQAYVTVPFSRGGQWVVGLAAAFDAPRGWNDGELKLLEDVVARVWPVIERARATADLQQSGERLNLALSAANLGDFSWEVQSDDLVLSSRAAEIFGVPPGVKTTRSSLRSSLHEDDQELARLANQRAMDTRTDYDIEYRVRLPSNEWRWVGAKGRGIYDANGAAIGMRGVVQDITARKTAEERLRDQEAQLRAHANELEQRVLERTASLQEAVSQMEEFSYSVSHDLRGPLRAMNLYAEALIDDYAASLDATARGYLDRIRRSSLRMEKLTHDVLTYSRVARTNVELAPIDIEKLIGDVINQYVELQPPHAMIEIVQPLYPVIGHEASLGQCLSNLLSNGAKFVAPGVRPHLRIWTSRDESRVRLYVDDNGIGIKPEHQSRLFLVFERLQTGNQYEGTGIGLAIVRKAMEKMGGRCGVESDGRNGSRFWLEFNAPGLAPA